MVLDMDTVTFELEDAPNGQVAVNSDCANRDKLKAIAVCCIRKAGLIEGGAQGLDATLDDINRLVWSSKLD